MFITVLLSHLQLKYLRVHIDNEKTFLLMQCFGVRGEGELKWRNCILSSWQSLLQILYYFHACIIHRKRQWYELYVQYMEIYDKTHIKFTESKEENKSQKRKGNQLCIRIFAFSCTHPTWKNYHSKTVGSLIKLGVIYSSFHDKKQEMSNLDAVASAIYPKRCIMSLSLRINLWNWG